MTFLLNWNQIPKYHEGKTQRKDSRRRRPSISLIEPESLSAHFPLYKNFKKEKMTSKTLKKEIEAWSESDVETALIELKEATENRLDFSIGENDEKFSITFPADYPKSKERFVSIVRI